MIFFNSYVRKRIIDDKITSKITIMIKVNVLRSIL